MEISVKKQYPAYYKKIKNLGYDTIEIRKLEPNLNLQSHFHPFTACMIILDGKVVIGENKTKIELGIVSVSTFSANTPFVNEARTQVDDVDSLGLVEVTDINQL